MRTILRLLVAVLAAVTLAAGQPAAQQQTDPAKIPGFMRATEDLIKGMAQDLGGGHMATPVQLQNFRTALLAVVEVIKKVPYFAHPIGFSSQPHVGLGDSTGAWRGTAPLPLSGSADVTAFIHFIDMNGKLRVVDGPIRGDDRPSQSLVVVANSLGCAMGGGPFYTDAEGPVFTKGKDPEKNAQGFPVYDHCVIVTQRKEPLTIPVSKERVLQKRIADATEGLKQIEAMAAAVPADRRASYADAIKTSRADLDKYKALLAGLSPEDRRSPAVVSFSPGQVFAAPDDPMPVPLVQPNPKFFDLTRPDQIQILVVRTGLSDKESQFMPQLDWAALLALAK